MIDDLKKIAQFAERESRLRGKVRIRTLKTVADSKREYPIYSFSLGTEEPTAPVLMITGGFHGLERIGAQLAWSLMKTTVERMTWDNALSELLGRVRMVVLPLVNPTGYYNYRRSNLNGVDLMRNSPIRAIDDTPPLVGGQRITNKLPWFQGAPDSFEPENQAVIEAFESEVKSSRCAVALDFHSGFGLKDRLWFPFSYTTKPFDSLSELHALTYLFEQTHPYHIYQIEPQSHGYLLNGDMWDYLYLEFHKASTAGLFLPVTLEMGSWSWVRKNPLQIFSKHGAFNPIKEHRLKRTYRRHHLLFDFLLKALYSNSTWSELDEPTKRKHHQLGIERWYSDLT
ncbi:MAG: DUF2817 domain-containing protein [Bdellovibrionales bacterium]|nr:DUF2817 domain-containing protein [Bdellovibrionales bacterium]